jgi:ATP-binding cassette, subfamily B, bacterial
MSTTLRVFNYTKRYPWLSLAQLSCAIISTLLVIVFPQVTRIIIDDVIPEQNHELLWQMVGLALLAFLGRDGFNSARIFLNNTFEQKVIFDLRSELYSKIQRLRLPWFDNKPTGDVMTRVAEDVTAMERVLIDGIEQGLVAVLQIGIIASVMFYMDAKLAAISLLPIPFLVLGASLYTRTAHKRYQGVRRATSAMNSLLHDNIAGIRQIKAYTMEEAEHARFNEASDKVRQASLVVMRAWAMYNPGMTFLASTGLVLVLAFGGQAAIDGRIEPGALAAFVLMLQLFYDPVNRLHSLNQLIQAGRAAGERVFDILDTEDEPGMNDGAVLEAVRGDIDFRNVGFSYTEKMPTLEGVSIRAEAGQTIALVGQTGAGKSTIINLLTRFYEYDNGEILIDGHSVGSLNKTSLREQIGYVTQESFLFNDTVRENLRIANREATDEEMWEALRIANATPFVKRLPDQLDSVVGERGVKLSVGEKQRISIARALLKNPPILLLDEATASVDTETERIIQEALERLMTSRTSIVIAHRLSTVRRADRIYVLDLGRVIEEGTHDELLALGGTYAKLCETAFLDESE